MTGATLKAEMEHTLVGDSSSPLEKKPSSWRTSRLPTSCTSPMWVSVMELAFASSSSKIRYGLSSLGLHMHTMLWLILAAQVQQWQAEQ